MGRARGADFQAAALPVTNASALDGNALRSAFGIGVNNAKGPHGGGDASAESKKKTKNELAAQ
eukprot:1604944-Pyramimonas_sp.AAC.1